MSEEKSKREILRDKVVDLVRMFINSEGGITQADLSALFGQRHCQEVATALAEMPIKLFNP